MSRPLVQIPNSVQVDNLSGEAVSLAGYYTIPAGASNHVIDMTKFSAFDGQDSIRCRVWNAIADGENNGSLNIDTVLTPAYSYATVDGPGFGASADDSNVLRPGLPGYHANTDKAGPRIVSAVPNAGTTKVIVTFSKPVYAAPGGTGPVLAADLELRLITLGGITVASLGTITKVGGAALTGGETVIECNITKTGTADGNEVLGIKAAAGAIVGAAPEKLPAYEGETEFVGVAP